MYTVQTLLLTVASLVAFATNSLLARAALAEGAIDAVTFTAVRLASGACLLGLIVAARRPRDPAGAAVGDRRRGSWVGAGALFVYALAFSGAYLSLAAGTGALILFGAVQGTMIGWGLWSGERPGLGQWSGLALAAVGLVYLLLPGVASPSLAGAVLMLASGVAWGAYSLLGRGVGRPTEATFGNFARAVPLALAALVVLRPVAAPSASGWILAATSGALTSGLGYVLWYRALRELSATVAAIVQLSVPVVAALGGVAVLGEALTARLVVASALILAGVAAAALSAPQTMQPATRASSERAGRR